MGEGPGVRAARDSNSNGSSPNNFGRWTSTALETSPASGGFLHPTVPPNFQAPPLNWFRGLNLEATMNEKNLSAHAEVIMQMPGKK
jgi:hypothetical protein